jgi:hypothetical protein
MSYEQSLPFTRGKTFYDGGTIDSNNLGGIELEGKEYVVPDNSPIDNTSRTGRMVRLRVVRNVSGFAIKPKYLVAPDTAAGMYRSRVKGYAAASAVVAHPVDEYLPAAGCPNNDLCYVVIHGPALCRTPLAGDATNVFSVGTVVVAGTGSTSGAITSGVIEPQVLTGATATLANQVQNRIGVALTARTTANTATDTLVDVIGW